MTDERDERRFERAGASLRMAGAHDSHALGEVVSALRHAAAESIRIEEAATVVRFNPARARPGRRRVSRATIRFAAGLAAGIAFAAGLGIGLLAGWRMRGASYRLATEDAAARGGLAAPLLPASGAAATHPVQFMLVAPSASRVALVGEFNDWDASATPMARAPGGAWHVALPLASGRHVYAFVIDGSSWVADPQAPLAPERWFGTQNSVLLVSAEQRQ